MSQEDNGNICSGGAGLLKPTSSSTEDLSEYTDADESISAPTEFLAEFLSAVMLKDYETALKYCKLILQYEPNNSTAKEFYPLILEKLRQIAYEARADESSSDEEEDIAPTPSSSSSEESDGEGSSDEKENSDKRTPSDGDATTASYSSLEDEEADQLNNLAAKYRVDNVDLGNGNKIICDSTGSKLWDIKKDTNLDTSPVLPFGTSSDSESPTEPVSQQTIAQLRAKVVPPFRH